MPRNLIGALAACLTIVPGRAPTATETASMGEVRPDPAPIHKDVPRPCGPARAIQCDTPEHDAPLPPWGEDIREKVHEDCQRHMSRSIFPRWEAGEAEHVTRFYCECLIQYAEQAMPEREAFSESAFPTYSVARATCARKTVRKFPNPTKPPPVNPHDT